MTDFDLDGFLALPLVGAIATLRADGSPSVVPIWYRWTGSAITVWTSPSFVWVKQIQKEPRVAFSVFEHNVPSRAVYVRGTASVAVGTTSELNDELRAITARYVPASRVDAEMKSYDNDTPKAVVTITPTWMKAETN